MNGQDEPYCSRMNGRRAALLVCGLTCSTLLHGAKLEPAANDAFDRYAQKAEARMQVEVASGEFMKPPPGVREKIVIETIDAGAIPDGLIHHRVAYAFAPGATFSQALALVEDYERYPEIYAPDIKACRVIERRGHDARFVMTIVKKKTGVSAIMDAEMDVKYTQLDPKRGYNSVRSVKITEAGREDNRGFLWRLNSYWRLEERDGGMYIRVESISLSRDAPAGLGWLVGGFIRNVHREFLVHIITRTRDALASIDRRK